MGTDEKGGGREVAEREQRQGRPGAVRGQVGPIVISVLGLATIGLLVALVIAVGKPVVEKRIGQAEVRLTPTPTLVTSSSVPALATPVTEFVPTPTPDQNAAPTPSPSGAWITLLPQSGPPGSTVEIQGYLPDAHVTVTNTVDTHADLCWGTCPGGLQYEGVAIHWSTTEPGHFTTRFTVPAAPWLGANGIQPLVPGAETVGIQCLDRPVLPTKGPGFVPCPRQPAQATATFHLTGAGSPDCSAGPCGRLSLSPDEGPPGTLVKVTGWAPLTNVMIGDRPFGYNLALQRAVGSLDNPWLGQVQQAPDGTVTGSFRVPAAFSSIGPLTPGSYTLALQALLNGAPASRVRPAPGLTVTPLTKGSTALGARVTLAPTTFTVTAAPSWASLGPLHPIRIQPSASSQPLVATAGDPANPRRLASCAPRGIEVSDDGGRHWASVPTTGIVQAAQGSPYELFPQPDNPPPCTSLAVDPTHPDSFYAGFSLIRTRYHSAPPEYTIGFFTNDAGQTWHLVPTPNGLDLSTFGGFQVTDHSVLALFSHPTQSLKPSTFFVQATSDGGKTWTSDQLPCPASGPCVRWGAADTIVTGMGATLPQPIERSTDNGQTWAPPSWPSTIPTRYASGQLVALGPTTVALVSNNSVNPGYPFLLSTDIGASWHVVSLPNLSNAGTEPLSFPSLQMLPSGDLLAHGDQSHGWLMLTPGASQWCEVTGAALPTSVNRLLAIGDRLWWVQAGNAPNQSPTLGSVAVSDLRCGQAIPTEYLTPTPTATAVIAPAAALRAVLDSPSVKGSSLFAIFPRKVSKQPCTIHNSGPAPGITISGICDTSVQANGSLDKVDFVEGWNATDFHAASDPANGWLTHTWTFIVDEQGKIVKQAETGNVPPQEMN